MPRGSKKGANQHNNRHENGIVAPGRRIAKQKSNGQLRDSNANSTPSDGSPRADTPPASSSPPVSQTAEHDSNCTTAPMVNGRLASATIKARSPSSPHSQTASHSPAPEGKVEETAAVEQPRGKMADSAMKRSDSNVGRSSVLLEGGPFHTAGTVLRSWPISDTLAVLVFLLSLPPALHSVINAVFTITTFVPPAGTFASLPTWSDLISSFSPTTPSLMVTALIDLVAMGLWVWLPCMFQALAIDSAQAIVATTLGGGYSNKPGSPDNTLLCLAFTMLTHLASRYASRYKHTVFQIFHRSEIERWPPQAGSIEERSLTQDYPVGYDRSWFDTIKVFLAIHIVCQGLTKMVRRSLSTSRTTQISSLAGRSGEGDILEARSTSVDVGDSSHHSMHQPQLRSKESLANLRDSNRDKISSGKRRRKQGNYTRSQQPLWAAFAASKATIFQSLAENKAGDDGKGTGATDRGNLGDAPFDGPKNSIWVTGIQPNSCFFETSAIESSWKNQRRANEDAGEGSDKPAPFYVTVNGAKWTSVKAEEIPSMERPHGCWVVEVYGLSPTCSYQILFKCHGDNHVLHAEAIATPAMLSSDKSPTAATAPTQIVRPSSPASPTATLETSIAGFESSIAEIKERQRRMRKEAKLAQANLRKEIEGLHEKIGKQADNVQNLQAKQTRENQHIRQATDAISTMAEELDTWKEIPDEELEEYQARKIEFETARNAHRDAKNELVGAKKQNERTLHTLQADINSIKQKNERLQARVAKLTAQHTRLTDPEAADATVPTGPAGLEPHRSNSSSSISRTQLRQDSRKKWDDQLEGRERMLQNMILHYNHNVNQYRVLAQQMEAAIAQAEPPRPITPEGDLPGTVPQPPSSTGNSRHPFDLSSRETFSTPDRFSVNHSSGGGGGGGGGGGNHFDPLTPSSTSLHKTNSTGGHGKTKPHSSSFGNVRPRSTSIMSGNTIYQDVDDGSGHTDVTSYEPFAPGAPVPMMMSHQFKRRSGGASGGLVREGSNGGSSGSGSPLVAAGVIRPPPPLVNNPEGQAWHAA